MATLEEKYAAINSDQNTTADQKRALRAEAVQSMVSTGVKTDPGVLRPAVRFTSPITQGGGGSAYGAQKTVTEVPGTPAVSATRTTVTAPTPTPSAPVTAPAPTSPGTAATPTPTVPTTPQPEPTTPSGTTARRVLPDGTLENLGDFQRRRSEDLAGRELGATGVISPGEPTAQPGVAAPVFQPSSKYSSMDANALFEEIKAGKIIPSQQSAAWTSLYQNGAATQAQIDAYAKWDQYTKEQVLNGTYDMVSDIVRRGTEAADKTKSEVSKVTDIENRRDEARKRLEELFGGLSVGSESSVTTSTGEEISLLGANASSALQSYKDIVANNPVVKELETEALAIRAEMDEMTANELSIENDIRKQVEGEAPQSVIEALAARAARDLYPKKFALEQKMNNLKSRIETEKSRAADLLKFQLEDEENAWNRAIQLYEISSKESRFARQDVRDEEADRRSALTQEIAIRQLLTEIPQGEVIELNGQVYEGMGKDDNIQVILETDRTGKSWAVGVDRNSGEELYRTFIVQGEVPGARTGGGGGGTAAAPSSKKVIETTYYDELLKGNVMEEDGNAYRRDILDAASNDYYSGIESLGVTPETIERYLESGKDEAVQKEIRDQMAEDIAKSSGDTGFFGGASDEGISAAKKKLREADSSYASARSRAFLPRPTTSAQGG